MAFIGGFMVGVACTSAGVILTEDWKGGLAGMAYAVVAILLIAAGQP